MNKKSSTKPIEMPSFIKFSVPYHNQFGQTLTQTLHIEHTDSVDEIKATIQSILCVDTLPPQNCGILVAHFYKDPVTSNFELGSQEEWEIVKMEWATHAVKKGKDVNIDIFFEHLKEAVQAQDVSSAKAKAKSKVKAVNPFLQQSSDDDKELEPDAHDLTPETTAEYHRELECLKAAWPCKDHQHTVCMIRALNGHHKVLNFKGELAWVLALLKNSPGVDLDHPLNIEYFKFFYHKSRNLDAPPLRHAGTRYHSKPPVGSQALATPININIPLEAFQFHHLIDSGPHERTLPSLHSSRDSSPEPWVLQTDITIPTIDKWLSELETKGLTYMRWNIL
ncbi:hypothetical protein K439DRAFT_1612745 [Ramaria rubella]|nr:hypothetical protein K439DRAFT_1612745 [Ramaria rubella]